MPHRTRTIDRRTTFASPPATVFAVVNSPETGPLIDPAVREWKADSRPISVGTRFKIRGRQGAVPIRATSEVATWEPPTLAEYRSVSLTWPFRMTARHQFDANTEDGTDYTWTISFDEVNVIARPLIAIAARLFKQALSAQAEALTKYLRELPDGEPLPLL